ncbi:MAG: heme exporter protein CcmD [Pseudomonadota bacterium]|nr:heme exporter protein CcmD [Pseudomonadota bacterium]
MFEFQFASLAAFFEMAPHGVYVWPTYGLGLLVLGGLTLDNARQHRRAVRMIQRNLKREETHES